MSIKIIFHCDMTWFALNWEWQDISFKSLFYFFIWFQWSCQAHYSQALDRCQNKSFYAKVGQLFGQSFCISPLTSVNFKPARCHRSSQWTPETCGEQCAQPIWISHALRGLKEECCKPAQEEGNDKCFYWLSDVDKWQIVPLTRIAFRCWGCKAKPPRPFL